MALRCGRCGGPIGGLTHASRCEGMVGESDAHSYVHDPDECVKCLQTRIEELETRPNLTAMLDQYEKDKARIRELEKTVEVYRQWVDSFTKGVD